MSASAAPPPSGLLVVDKPAGLTSHDVVARVRRLAGTRKVGHAGTLDPMATGVLVLGVGRATRLLGHLVLAGKDYDATARLGWATTTDDAEGEPLAVADPTAVSALDDDQVRRAFAEQVGDLAQVPSSVSAVKVDGRRAYDRVRAGESVELAARQVRVDELVVHRTRAVPEVSALDAEISVRCSSGTYVRAIARDVGVRLGVGGHLTALRRTTVGPFTLAEARTLDELADEVSIVPIAEAAARCFTALTLDEAGARDVSFGRTLDLDLTTTTALFAPDGALLALYGPHEGRARAVAVFV